MAPALETGYTSCHDGADIEARNMDPIAVVGYSLRFPQEATTAESFWEMLREGRSAMTEVPSDRFNVNGFYHPDASRTDTINFRGAHFLKEDPSAFDAPFFSMNPNEAMCMDPQQRALLEVTYRAFENAGIPMETAAGSNTSVYLAAAGVDYERFFEDDQEIQATYKAIGNSATILSNRLSWFYDLRGTSMTIETACSSSLVALHLACQNLRLKESRTSLVCASQLFLEPMTSAISLSNLKFESPDSHCYSFDERGNGYSKGEGFCVAVLKRLSDALEDGDTIRGVVRGTSSNQDGRTPGISQPSAEAQEALIRDAYQPFGLSFEKTRFFEAHGTGTALGDPVESSAISSVFSEYRSSEDPLYVGAVKSGLGHLEAAAGLAGFIKTLLVLEKGIIPPNYDLQRVNPRIPVEQWRIKFPREAVSWPSEGLRRASVNAFGYGGTNAHVVLDDACHYLRTHGLTGSHFTVEKPPGVDPLLVNNGHFNGIQKGMPDEHFLNGEVNEETDGETNGHVVGNSRNSPYLFLFSASDVGGIERLNSAYEVYLQTHNQEFSVPFLRDLAFTLSNKRSVLPWKSYLLASSVGDLREKLLNATLMKPNRSSTKPRIQFIFTGQGVQWACMGLELFTFPVFKNSLESADRHLRSIGCTWSLMDELLCTAIQVALTDLLTSWKVYPWAVLGHSSGEIAAAYCAGGISKESAWTIAYHRGALAAELAKVEAKDRGAMMSVALSETEVQPYFAEIAKAYGGNKLSVGCVNSADNTTVTGLEKCIDALKLRLDGDGIFARKLNIPVAYHSRHMQVVKDDYLHRLEGISSPMKGQSIAEPPLFFSSVTGGAIILDDLAKPDYWAQNILSKVRFSEALQQLCAGSTRMMGKKSDGASVKQENHFVEVGPHPALQRPVRDTVSAHRDAKYESTLRRGVPGDQTMGDLLGKLFTHGYTSDFQAFNGHGPLGEQPRMLIDLPEYPFDHSHTYWLESRLFKNYRFRNHLRHELVGNPTTDWNPLEPKWRFTIRVSDLPWVEDHKFNGSETYPAAGMLAMVVEAARYLASPEYTVKGYRIRDVLFLNALLIPTTPEGVESQLHLRYQKNKRTTNTKSIDCREFRLCVYSNEEWRDVCTGTVATEYMETPDEVFTGSEKDQDREQQQLAYTNGTKTCTATADRCQFYKAIIEMGSDFGPTFHTLHDISYDPEGNQAAAKVVMDEWRSKVPEANADVQEHVIHPTTLDGVLQVAAAALTKGGTKETPLLAPTQIREFFIANDLLSRNPGSSMKVLATNEFHAIRDVDSSIVAFLSDTFQPAISIDGYRVTAVSSLDDGPSEMRKTFYNLDWKPDVDLLDREEIKHYCFNAAGPLKAWEPINDVVCLYFISQALNDLERMGYKSPTLHFQKYVDWIRYHFQMLGDRNPLLQPKWKDIFDDEPSRKSFLDSYKTRGPEERALALFCQQLPQILREEVDPLHLLFNEGLAKDMYTDDTFGVTARRMAALVGLLAHKDSSMNILEIGSGTGSGSEPILNVLAQQGRHHKVTPRYESYSFTDISPSFFEEARTRFAHHGDRLSFKALDIEKDPEEQGFKLGHYDLVIAATVLHATATINQTLQHVRSLLKPSGYLILMEPTNKQCTVLNGIWGTLSGWWRSTENDRFHGPLYSEIEWDSAFRRNGFTGVELALPDYPEEDHHVFNFLVSKANPITDTGKPSIPPALVVAADTPVQQKVASEISSTLLSHGSPNCDVISPPSILQRDAAGVTCVSLLELDGSFVNNMNEEELAIFKRLVECSSELFWMQCGAGESASRPENAMASGFGRAIMQERPGMYFATVDVETASSAATTFSKIIKDLFRISNIDNKESDFLERDGIVQIPRVVQASDINNYVHSETGRLEQETREVGYEPDEALELQFSSGRLDRLHFIGDVSIKEPLGQNEVEVQVKATGINFVDVMVILGHIADDYIGQEYSGIVTRIGSSVTNVQQGDPVCGIAKGAFKSYARSLSCAVIKLTDSWAYTEASSIPAAFITAHYGLSHLGRLQKGESVLIHAAAGAVGQAAIQLAKLLNADIFVTVSTTSKKELLMKHYDIPEDRFFSSRKLSFGRQILRATGGRGVDVVLNSLSGESLVESWRCIAYLGRFVEIGKRDIRSFQSLPMWTFSKNVSFSSLDIQVLYKHRHELMGQLMSELGGLMASSPPEVKSPQPLSVFKRSEFETAFRYLQTGHHMGKAVIDWEKEASIQVIPKAGPHYYFGERATYVIVGGLGGIGRSLALWFAERGAKHLILLSRSGLKTEEASKLVDDLVKMGTKVVTPKCDISDADALESTVKECGETMPPIKGCIQGAMVLRDRLFGNMTREEWQAVIDPKVRGTWNLHNKLPDNLDFFVILSSLGGMIGARAQSQYNAAATFQDAFARHRVSLGQKCISIDIGLVTSVGYVAEHQDVARRWENSGLDILREEELHSVVGWACDPARTVSSKWSSQVLTAVGKPAELRKRGEDLLPYMRRPLYKHLHLIDDGSSGPATYTSIKVDYGTLIRAAETKEEAGAIVASALAKRLSRALSVPEEDIDLGMPAHSFGVDSLVAVELRFWFGNDIKADMSVFSILGNNSIADLGSLAAGKSEYFHGSE